MGMHFFGKEGKLLGEKVLKELCATWVTSYSQP